MRQNLYTIKFSTGQYQSEIRAFNVKEAVILAQAEQILKGNDYIVSDVYVWKNDAWSKVIDFK